MILVFNACTIKIKITYSFNRRSEPSKTRITSHLRLNAVRTIYSRIQSSRPRWSHCTTAKPLRARSNGSGREKPARTRSSLSTTLAGATWTRATWATAGSLRASWASCRVRKCSPKWCPPTRASSTTTAASSASASGSTANGLRWWWTTGCPTGPTDRSSSAPINRCWFVDWEICCCLIIYFEYKFFQ